MARLDDYNDVSSRLREMRELYPELSLQCERLEILTLNGVDGILYVAAAYRSPEDNRPGIGTAWEPVPAVNATMRNSEVMLAETSAWGRALVAIGADTKKGIASRNEVAARMNTSAPAATEWGNARNMIQEARDAHAAGNLEHVRELYREAVRIKATPAIIEAIKEIGETPLNVETPEGMEPRGTVEN